VEGGETIVSDVVYEVVMRGGTLYFEKVARLPVGVMASSAVLVRDRVCVFSGVGDSGEVEGAWAMEISDNDRGKWRWESLGWPEASVGVKARARGYHVTGGRDGRFYVFGGRGVSAEGVSGVKNRLYGTDDFRDCYEFEEESGWRRLADLPSAISGAPGNAVVAGAGHLLIFGGVNLELLEDVAGRREELGLNEGLQGFGHSGFLRDVLAYHVTTDTWSRHGEIPAGVKAPVTAPLVSDGGDFLILSGEWSPKLRSSGVLAGRVEAHRAAFGFVNWLVVGVYLLGMVGIGYWFMKREAAATTDDYFRGGQRIPWWVAGLSIFATLLSSITFMAIPALSYAGGWNKWSGQWPIVLIVPLVVFAYMPFFRKLNVTSAYEYLEARFNLAARLFASAAFMVFHVGRIAIVLYLPALALSSVTNIDIVAAISVIGILCVIYTVMGGIEAVVWTDAIQALVLLGGALLCFLLVVFSVDDGFGTIVSTLGREDKFLSLDWGSVDIGSGTRSGWMFVLGFFFATLPAYTSSQDVVQRYVTTSSMKEASRSLWLNIFMTLVGSAVFFALGTALYVFYAASPEKLDPTLGSTDGILPFFIMQNLPVGVAGLIIAGVFAAAQSTISSSLNSVATAFVTDFYGRVFAPESTDAKRLRVARNVVVLLGVTGVGVAILIARSDVKSAFDAFNVFIGFVLGPLAAMFALGVFTRRVGGGACLIGAVVGAVSIVVVTVLNGRGVIDVWPLLNGLICFVVTFGVAVLVGFFWRSEVREGLTIYDVGRVVDE